METTHGGTKANKYPRRSATKITLHFHRTFPSHRGYAGPRQGSPPSAPPLHRSPARPAQSTRPIRRVLVDVRRPATRRVQQLLHALHVSPALLLENGHRLPELAPGRAVIIRFSTTVRAVPHGIESRQHGHGIQVRGGHPAVAVEFRPDTARVHPVLAVRAECHVLAGIAQGKPVL